MLGGARRYRGPPLEHTHALHDVLVVRAPSQLTVPRKRDTASFSTTGGSSVRGSRGQRVPEGCRLCVLPHRLLNAFLDIDAGLSQGRAFLLALAEEYEDYCGNVGVNVDAQRFLGAAATCWDWQALGRARPTAAHVQAFNTLFTMSQRLLEKGEKSVFPYAQGPLPTPYIAARQYMLLCKRVRAAVSKGRFLQVTEWRASPLLFHVAPLSLQFRDQRLGGMALPLYLVSAFVADLADLYAWAACPPALPDGCDPVLRPAVPPLPWTPGTPRPSFAGMTLDVALRRKIALEADFRRRGLDDVSFREHPFVRFLRRCGESFVVRPESLCLPGAYHLCRLTRAGRAPRFGVAKLRAHRARMCEGEYGVLARGPAAGRLVRMVAAHRCVDEVAIARAIDMEPALNAPNSEGEHCHLACELHHISRFSHR